MPKFFTIFIFAVLFCLDAYRSEAQTSGVPVAPGKLTLAVVSESRIDVSWSDLSADETGFELERAAVTGGPFTRIATLAANLVSYSDINLKTGTAYCYRVRAKNLKGNSTYAGPLCAATKNPVVLPNAPDNLKSGLITSSEISLSWDDNASNETGFEIERSGNGTAYAKLSDLPANTTTYKNTGLNPFTKYWYRIRAKNTAGLSAYSNVVEATTLQIIPAEPSDLNALATSTTQINVTWKDNAANETGFQLERSLNGTTFSKISDLAVNAMSFQNSGLAVGTTYFYRIRAVNAVGASEYSNIASATTWKPPVPARPEGLNAVPSGVNLVELRWLPLSSNAREVIIERSLKPDTEFTQIGRQAASITTFPDRQKLNTADYYYRVAATNEGGISPYSLVSIVRAASIVTAVEPLKDDNLVYATDKWLVVELKQSIKATLRIYNAAGRLKNISRISGSSRTDLGSFSAGIYLVVIDTGKELINRKIAVF